MITDRYTAHGYTIAFEWEDQDLAAIGRKTVEYHGFRATPEESPAPDGTITVARSGELQLPAGLEPVVRHRTKVAFYRDDGLIWLERSEALMRLDPASGDATIVLDAGTGAGSGAGTSGEPSPAGAPTTGPKNPKDGTSRTHAILYLLLTFGLVLYLQHRRLYVLHTAAVGPGPDAEDGVLVVAGSGSGKSTLALTLVDAGWRYVSDDSVLLDPSGDFVTAVPLRRDAAIDARSLDRFAAAAGHESPLFSDRTKRLVDMDAAWPGRRLERIIPRNAIFPVLTGETESRLEPVEETEAMVSIVKQASFLAADPHTVNDQMDTLKDLLEQMGTWRLHAGRDLVEQTGRAEHILRPLLNS